MANQHDDAVDKVLAAMRTATPPEGMEARIAQRLQHREMVPATHAYIPSATWWRGALAGVATTTLAACVMLLILHRSQPAPTDARVAETPITVDATPVSAPRAVPCTTPNTIRVHTVVPLPMAVPQQKLETLRAENLAPSHPAPESGLTTQERQLLRLAKTADLNQLATLNPETQAKLEAQEEAEFQKFFPPSPPSPQPTGNNE